MEFKTKSGCTVTINEASFEDAINLKNSIMRELSSVGFTLDAESLKGVDFNSDIDSKVMSKIVNAIMAVDSSNVVFENIFKCLERSKYNSEKITKDTFEDLKARESYYEIIIACVKVNLAPFLKGLVSMFGQLSQKNAKESQK